MIHEKLEKKQIPTDQELNVHKLSASIPIIRLTLQRCSSAKDCHVRLRFTLLQRGFCFGCQLLWETVRTESGYSCLLFII